MKEKTILAFDASLQKEVEHIVDIDGNGDFVLTSPTGSFIKFSGTMNVKEIKDALNKHKKANEGQISEEVLRKKKEELLNNF